MTDSPRPPSIYRVQSTTSEARQSIYPIQSAQSSLSSFTSYFGASTLGPDDDQHAINVNSLDSPVPAIAQAFAPYIPVVASQDANDLAKRKGFSSLFDLLRPFGDNLESKVTCKDSNGQTINLDNFNLNFVEMGPLSNLVNYGQPDVQRPGLVPPAVLYAPGGDLVALERQIENEMRLAGENMTDTPGSTNDKTHARPGSIEYFDSFFSSLLTAIPTSPHETFSHPVASCIIISSHNQSPIESLVSLYKSSSEHLPSYIDPGFLRYYILIHDEDEHDLEKSLTLFSRMKNSFGTHCCMLRLTSKTVTIDDDAVLEVPTFTRKSAPERLRARWHGSRANSTFLPTAYEEESSATKIRYIPYADHAGIVSMVREMITQSIVPYMERCISLWNDQVAGPRRGLAGRFFKAGRTLFGTSRSATPTHGNGNYDPASSSYPPNSPEAQLRKLADFAFMLRDWKLANSVYDMLRKDFSNDKAWKHHAGAQEMFVVSQLLMSAPITPKIRAEIIEPTLDSALYGYLSRCSSPYSALRSMLLTAELLRIRPNGAKDDAAKWIMRTMETNLVGEMTRALLVERTAYCFSTGEAQLVTSTVVPGTKDVPDHAVQAVVNYRGSRLRKAAFWSVLAAEHWSTIGKHRLARQALSEALQVYGNTKWIAIQGTLNLLKTESGLVKDYQLTPPVVTPTEELESHTTPPANNTQEKMESIHAVLSASSSVKSPTRQLPNEDEDEDETVTNATAMDKVSANDIAADDLLKHDSINEVAKQQNENVAKEEEEEEEVDDPLRIE